MRFSRAAPATAAESTDGAEVPKYKDPSQYFYEMFKSHVYDMTATWGDVYRIFKYFRRFSNWDMSHGIKNY